MSALVITIHIIACVFLIILVLLQSGKEGMGVIFGGGSSSVFGSSGAGGLLVRLTAGAAIIFLITSLSYNRIISSRHVPADSIMPETQTEAPAPATAGQPETPQGGAGFEVAVPMANTQGGTQVQVPAPGSAPEGQAPAAAPAPQPEPAKPQGNAQQ